MMCLRTFTVIALFVLVCDVTCKNMDKYDHFIYTQQWPQSLCTCPNEYNESCRIPDDVKTWTIHGLWPTLGKSKDYPEYCNKSWKFEEDKISKIESKLKIYWPSLLFNSNSISFWKHEWDRHGTCCTNLPRLNSEFKYFNEGLNLNQKFDLLSMLKEAKITPSKNKSYQLGEIRKAIAEGANGHKPYLHCCKGDDRKQRIVEVMICLDAKMLTPIDCVEDDENCNEDAPIYYEPIIPSDMNLLISLK